MTSNPIIALGGKARHGKNTTAQIIRDTLEEDEIEVLFESFAKGVKEEALAAGWNGLKDEAGRALLNEIGQNRRSRDPLYWVRQCFSRIESQNDPSRVWVIVDCRYTNEADFVRQHGGLLWRVRRISPDGSDYDNGLGEAQKNHASEVDLDEYPGFSLIIEASSVEGLRGQVRAALRKIDPRRTWRVGAETNSYKH